MPKTFSPQLEQALDEATDGPLVLTTAGKPSLVIMASDLFDDVIFAIDVDADTYNPRVITRDGKPEITMLQKEQFDLMDAAFQKATAPRGSFAHSARG